MRSAVFLVLAALVCCTSAQQPVPCRSPPEFEAKVVEVVPHRKEEVFASVSYDALTRRVRFVDFILVNDTKEAYDVLELHNIGLEYVFNMKTKNCTVRPLTRPFRHVEIPRDAHYRGELYIGGSVVGTGVLVSMWNGTTPDQKGKMRGTWTQVGCLPVGTGFFFPPNHAYISNFFDVTIGIRNPDVFIPPPECTKAKSYRYNTRTNSFMLVA